MPPGFTLNPRQLASRRRFDWEIVQEMNGDVIHAVAYRSTSDLEKQRNPITCAADAGNANVWLVEFHVPTLAGPSKRLHPVTTLGFNTQVEGYPFTEPINWVRGFLPWSPHFMQGMPACTGAIWKDSRGSMLLGHLLVHVARLLNFDEPATGNHFNRAANEHHRSAYGGKPLNPNLRYPVLPAHLTHPQGSKAASGAGLFAPSAPSGSQADWFTVKGGS